MPSSFALFPLFFLFFLSLFLPVFSVNPVKIPIIKNAMNVHTRRFAKLPDSQGDPARINALIPRGSDLYAVTLTKIYKVSRTGAVSLWFDVAAAIRQATNRDLSITNKKHGGVRSLAFHPGFKNNRLIYISAMETRPKNPAKFTYISDSSKIDADSVLLEFRCARSGKPRPGTYRNVFRIGMPVYDHPIKQIAFHKGLLYIAHGDGSEQSATAGGGQKNDALGKILRINPRASNRRPYTVPNSNPFTRSSKFKNEIWALGFRNPHHICFGKDGTLFAVDAGRSNVEEVNIIQPGKNYGWANREGTFVHAGGGLVSGIRDLPNDDAKFGYTYPNAQVGHDGPFRSGFIGQAIAGGCPVENGSPMAGNYFYADFPQSGKLYFSRISELKRAVVRGAPNKLRQARTRQAVIYFDHDNNPKTAPRRYDSLGAAMRSESQFRNEQRVDVRFGRGSRGELYWSSKISGTIYIFTSSLKGGLRGQT